MSIKDVIKSSVYNSLGGGANLSISSIFLILAAACLLGVYIFMVYKLTSKAAFYSKDLNVTMAGMPVIIAAIMIAMQSNLIVSLGMVGALSIVRFRNAIKNPLDLLYLFWAISAGIICGVGLTVLASCLCIVMTIMLLALEMIPNSKASSLLILRTNEKDVAWDKVESSIREHVKYCKEKSRSIKNREVEVIYEVRTIKENELVKTLQEIEDLEQIHFLSHDGEYRV